MSKLSLFRKKGSEPMVTEAKSLRQQMAEQESGFRVVRKAPGSPKVGEVYEGEYWTVEWPNAWDFCVLERRSCYTSLTCEEDTELEALRRLRVATIKAHPGMEPLFGHLGLSHYATQDEALCALEKALYGFDLSGRKEDPEDPKAKPTPNEAPLGSDNEKAEKPAEKPAEGPERDTGREPGAWESISITPRKDGDYSVAVSSAGGAILYRCDGKDAMDLIAGELGVKETK